MIMYIVFDRCLENVYALRYEQTLATLQHKQLTTSALDNAMDAEDDDGVGNDVDDASMDSD